MIAHAKSFVEDFSDILTEMRIDDAHFRVTANPVSPSGCILWHWNGVLPGGFAALGQFSNFDKRTILEFIAKYTTSPDLRKTIRRKYFDRRVEKLEPSVLDALENITPKKKETAYRNLFALDNIVDRSELEARRRIMAKKFHPDSGGSNSHMRLINEAFDHLLKSAVR